jgi:uncharacterized protein YndB with AHSA1/START domain
MNNPEANLDADRLGTFGTDQLGNKTITYTRLLNHPIEKVWRAIADETHRAAWFPELTLSHQTGGDAVVNFSGSDCPPPESNPSDIDFCKVTRFEPPNILEYSGPSEHHLFELVAQGTGCLLKFLATLPEAATFDDDANTIQTRYSIACGWHYKLDEMEWDLDGIPFKDEGYAGPAKTKYYFAYRKLDSNKEH